MHQMSQDRHARSQVATTARDQLEQEITDLQLDAAWTQGCGAALLIAWKNKVMDLEMLRDVGDPGVTDPEQRIWLSRSSLMRNQMRAAVGNLVSNKLLNAMA
jgi:hypothetical protein